MGNTGYPNKEIPLKWGVEFVGRFMVTCRINQESFYTDDFLMPLPCVSQSCCKSAPLFLMFLQCASYLFHYSILFLLSCGILRQTGCCIQLGRGFSRGRVVSTGFPSGRGHWSAAGPDLWLCAVPGAACTASSVLGRMGPDCCSGSLWCFLGRLGWSSSMCLHRSLSCYWGCLAFGFDGRPCISEGLGCESNCSSPVRAFLWHSGQKGSVRGSVTQVFGVTDSHYVVWSLCEPQIGFLPHLAGSNLISSCTRSRQRSNAD